MGTLYTRKLVVSWIELMMMNIPAIDAVHIEWAMPLQAGCLQREVFQKSFSRNVLRDATLTRASGMPARKNFERGAKFILSGMLTKDRAGSGSKKLK